MGRKIQGAALRAKKRAQEASLSLVEATATQVESQHVVKKTDDELFVLDTTASSIPGGIPKEGSRQKRKKGLTAAEQKQVDVLLESYDAASLKAIAEESRNQMERAKKQKQLAATPTQDLWSESPQESTVKDKPIVSPGIGDSLAGTAPAHVSVKPRAAQKLKKNVLAVQVAHGGQSYQPDKEQHQDVIGEALALELRRKQVSEYNATPVSVGMLESTKALLLGSDDENDDTQESSQDNIENATNIPILKKRKEKLTRVDRNRQKRHRALEREIQERKRAAQLVNSLHEVKRIKKEFDQKEKEKAERRALVEQLKLESERTLGKHVLQALSQRDPVGVPALPVALTAELQSSSLRSIKPKGSLLEDRLESFRDRKMATPKIVGDRKKVVHGKKRKVKVKGGVEHRLQLSDGTDLHFMG